MDKIYKCFLPGVDFGFAATGTQDGENTVGPSALPTPESPAWGEIGRCEKATPQFEKNAEKIKQCTHSGKWRTDEVNQIDTRKFLITTRDCPVMGLKMMLGVETSAGDAATLIPFAGTGEKAGWLKATIYDANDANSADGVALGVAYIYGKLRLAADVEINGSVASVQFEFIQEDNSLASYTDTANLMA